MEEVAREKTLEEKMAAVEEAEEEEKKFTRRQTIGLIIAFAILLGLHFGPTVSGLKPQAQSVLGVFLWFITCMVTDALPKAVVGLASPLLLVIFAKVKIPEAFNAFNKDIFLLGAGAFIYAGIMMGTPLGRRIALTITTAMRSNRVTRVLLGLSASDLAIGGVLPTVSETALFLPIAKGVGTLMRGMNHLPEVKRINTALLLLITGLMPLFTGPLILTSHFPNIMLVGNLKDMEGIYISWIQWFWLNLPLWGLLPILFIYVVWWFKLRGLDIPGAEVEIPKMKKELGRISWSEIWALICFGIGITLWVTEEIHKIKSGMVALTVVALMFMPWGRIKFKQINPHIMWDILMLLGGAISLGTVLYKSGAVAWLANIIVDPVKGIGLPVLLLLFILVFAMHIARAGIVSAVAMGAAFIPLTVGIAKTLGYSILPFTLVVINCLSYAFFLPISITAFLIAWGASEASGWEVIKFGGLLSIIANIYVIVVQTGWLA
ncbi:MAG: SLC13 family permease, partial [Nitrospirota bacterium]